MQNLKAWCNHLRSFFLGDRRGGALASFRFLGFSTWWVQNLATSNNTIQYYSMKLNHHKNASTNSRQVPTTKKNAESSSPTYFQRSELVLWKLQLVEKPTMRILQEFHAGSWKNAETVICFTFKHSGVGVVQIETAFVIGFLLFFTMFTSVTLYIPVVVANFVSFVWSAVHMFFGLFFLYDFKVQIFGVFFCHWFFGVIFIYICTRCGWWCCCLFLFLHCIFPRRCQLKQTETCWNFETILDYTNYTHTMPKLMLLLLLKNIHHVVATLCVSLPW